MAEFDAVSFYKELCDENANPCDDTLRALAREAERRGMMRAAGICRSHRVPKDTTFEAAAHNESCNHCAAAIERAAKEG